jgi:hypothetical protein
MELPTRLAVFLSERLGRDLRTEQQIRAQLAADVLSLPDDVTYGRATDGERLAASPVAFERAAKDNPAMEAVLRASYASDARRFEAALSRSQEAFSGDPYPDLDELISARGVTSVTRAIEACPYNVPALHALGQVFFFTGQPLALMRVALEGLRLEPSHFQRRYIAANGAMKLGWHKEAVQLLEPNLASLLLGLNYDAWSMFDQNARFVESLCGWNEEHLQSGKPGLVGGMLSSTGAVLVDPFARMRGSLALCASHCDRASQKEEERREDRARLGQLLSRARQLQATALRTGRLDPAGDGAKPIEIV